MASRDYRSFYNHAIFRKRDMMKLMYMKQVQPLKTSITIMTLLICQKVSAVHMSVELLDIRVKQFINKIVCDILISTTKHFKIRPFFVPPDVPSLIYSSFRYGNSPRYKI